MCPRKTIIFPRMHHPIVTGFIAHATFEMHM